MESQATALPRLCSEPLYAAIERVVSFYFVLHIADLVELSVVTLHMLFAKAEDRRQRACRGELEKKKTVLLYFVVL